MLTNKGSIFIVNPFENASGAAHFTYHIEKCKDESGVEITKTFCKPYTITSESRNYKLIKDSESKLIKVGASTYDEYLQKTGRKFVDRNYKYGDRMVIVNQVNIMKTKCVIIRIMFINRTIRNLQFKAQSQVVLESRV